MFKRFQRSALLNAAFSTTNKSAGDDFEKPKQSKTIEINN